MSGTRFRQHRHPSIYKPVGFTLIELVVAIAIIGLLAGIVAPVATGLTSTAKAGKKAGEFKAVEDAVVRFEAKTSTLPFLQLTRPEPADISGKEGLLTVVVDVDGVPNPQDFPADPNVTCTGADVQEALGSCFGGIDFSLLVPNFLKQEPAHSRDLVTVSQRDGADLVVTGVNQANDKLELYTDTEITADDGLLAWNLTARGDVLVLVGNEKY